MLNQALSGRVDYGDPRADQGRYEDNRMAHVASGEFIVPEMILEGNPALKAALIGEFEKHNIDPREFIVDSGANKVNPQTGEQEYFLGLDQLIPIAAPIAGGIFGGPMGAAAGMALGQAYGASKDKKAAEAANAAAQAGYGQASQMLAPYQQMGQQGMQQYQDRINQGFNRDQYMDDEGYQFRLKQGMKSLDNQMAAQGMGNSGAALKAGQRYAQGLASQEHGNAYQRWLQDNQQFAGMGNMGLSAALGLGQNAIGAGTTAGQAEMAKQSMNNQALQGGMQMAMPFVTPWINQQWQQSGQTTAPAANNSWSSQPWDASNYLTY